MKRTAMIFGQRVAVALCPVLTAALLVSAQPAVTWSQANHIASPQEKMPRRDINAVLRDHDRDLLAIPGVVGVFVGVLGDGTTLCLKVMVVRKDEDLRQKIPQTIEGYPVVIEESGVIRPL